MGLHVCDVPDCGAVMECVGSCTVDPNLPYVCPSCRRDNWEVGECYDCRETTVLMPRVWNSSDGMECEPGDTCGSCREHLPAQRPFVPTVLMVLR